MDDYIDEVLYEMNISNLTPIRISTNRLYVDRPTIFLTLPDTDVNIQNVLYTSGLLLTNCDGIITQNRIVKIVRRNYNGKVRFLDLKKYFIATKPKGGKKLRVLSSLPANRDSFDKNFYFYDLGLYSDALKSMMEMFSPKIATQYLFSELMKIYTNIKNTDPMYRVEILLLCNDNKGFLYQLFKNIKIWIPEDDIEKLECYDNFILGSNCNNLIAPLFKKDKLRPALQYPNIIKFMKYLDNQTEAAAAEELKITNSKESPTIDTKLKTPSTSIFSKIADSLKSNKLINGIDEEGNINIGLDNRQLSQTLSKYKIKDPDIVANVKAALDTYVKEKGAKLTKDEAESAVLKAINYTVHGKEELDEEYLAHPNRLIEKLAQTRTHKTPLQFPETNTSIVNPTEVIDIDYTTGVWRQKQEFENTIHKNVKRLFDSLQNVSNAPIKIKKIDHQVIDDEQNRLINYKITLQNTGGGTKDLYQVELNVPAPVNDRYFKLRGSQYIMAAQQFFKPVTKTDKNEVRVLSNYAIVRIQLQNLKFNPSNNDDLISYIQTRYPTIIKELNDKSCTLNDGSIIYFTGNTIFSFGNENVSIDEDTGRLSDQNGVKLPVGKNEFIYEKLRDRILAANPEDKLTKTKKSIPYFQFYIGGIKLPLILYLWQLQGLVKTLSDAGVEYKITESPNPEDIVVKMSEGKWLAMYPDNLRERLLCNGILAAKIKDEIPDLSNPSAIYPFIEKNYGARTILQLRIMTQNMIDPVTKEMLEFENLSTNLPNLVTTKCIDMLLNQKPDKLSDLKLYRARMSEIILNIMYKQLMMAHNTYHQKVEEFNDPNAKLMLMPDFILNEIITTAGVLQYTEAANPVDEIGLASRTIKTGPGGVPNHRAFKVEHRNIHPSQYGIMSAVMTPEHSSVGLVVSHTLTPVIVNELGSYGNKDLATMKKYGTLSINEALTPFQNEMDSDRLLMSTAHTKQVTPTDGNEAPLVGTGAEFIVPQISSTRFVQKAKKDGIITEVDNHKTMSIKYNDGTTENLDILPRLSRTKMGCYISLPMIPLEVNTKVKKNQIVAHTKNFDHNGIYASGRNVFMAMMNYRGLSHEDAYVVNETLANTMERDIIKEVSVVVPPETKILYLEKEIGKQVTSKDVLVEFSYKEDLDKYLDLNQLDDLGDNEILSTYVQGQESIKLLAKDGIITDIKIFINNKNSADRQLITFHSKMVTDTKKIIGKLSQNITDKDNKLKVVDNINLNFMKIGDHKIKGNEFQGVKVSYFIRQKQPLTHGDKISTRFGAKGVISKVIPMDQDPYSEVTKKPIEVFISPLGVFSRKNICMVKELYLGKVIYFLNEKIHEMANNPKVSIDKIIKLIKSVYGLLGCKEVEDSVNKTINSMSESTFRKLIKDPSFTFRFTVPPFSKTTFESIKSAADILGIPLDEKVYVPELKCWTKDPVPVGVTYIQALEQTAEIYSNIRSAGKYQSLTGQATKGKTREGGQSLGNLDVYALLTYDAPDVLKELMTLRSDDHRSKRQVINSIISTGQANIPISTGGGATSMLLDVYMTGLGLETTD